MPRKSQSPPSGYTILVVDDQVEALESVRPLLERDGHTVLTAESGEQALALFRTHDVHLLLVDYFMPRMTGEELIRRIRALDPLVQIILRTGYSGEKPARAMLAELDIQGYVDKAHSPEKLLLWVDVALKAHRMICAVQQREALHNELLANVSHEFRTPLNIVRGYTDLMLDKAFGPLPATAEQPLRSMAEATDSLTELVADFLDYAKLEARAGLNRQLLSTTELAREFERLGAVLLEGRDVDFAVELGEVPDALETDSLKLRTILRNLVTNAVKFTAVGSIALRMTRDAATLRFAVADTGPGVPAEDLERIFEPFRQLNGGATGHRVGFGLGLALSRRLARVLGGDIEVESRVGMGSVFTLVLPVEGDADRQSGRDPCAILPFVAVQEAQLVVNAA